MRSTRRVAAIAGVAMASVAFGRSAIESHRAPDAPSSPRRVYIVTDIVGTERLDAFLTERDGRSAYRLELEKAVEVRLTLQLRRCGVEVAGYETRGLEFEEEIAKQRAAFNPDAILTVRRDDVSADQDGAHGELWDIALRAPPANGEREGREWWRAAAWVGILDFGPRRSMRVASTAEAFVDELVDRWKADGFFPSCSRKFAAIPSISAAVPKTAYAATSEMHASGGLRLQGVTWPAGRAGAREEESAAARRRALGQSGDADPSPANPSLERLRGPLWGVGRTDFSPDLEAYVGGAISSEMKRVGIDVDDPRHVLIGELEDAVVDYSGWGHGCTVRMRFELKDASTGQSVYSASKTASTVERAVSEVSALDQVLRTLVEALLQDPDFQRAIQ